MHLSRIKWSPSEEGKMLHHNELITIEEETLLNVSTSRNGMQRKFTFTNQSSKFSFGVLTSGGSIVSIKINNGTHEIVLPTSVVSYLPLNNGQLISSFNSATGKRDLDSYPSYCEWISHVLGSDTLLLTTSSSQSIIYQLTSSDELIITGKLKNCHAIAPFYFNLNDISSSVNGHFLQLRCLDTIHYEIVACSPPINGNHYNSIMHNINFDSSSSSVNSTTAACDNSSAMNAARASANQRSVKFDIISGSTIIIDDHSCCGNHDDDNVHRHVSNSNQSALIQDTVYTVVPVINCNSNASSSSCLISSSSNCKEYFNSNSQSIDTTAANSDDVSDDLVESISTDDHKSQSPSTIALNCKDDSPFASSSSHNEPASSCIEAPVLVLTLSYAGRCIEMSLQSNSTLNQSNSSSISLPSNQSPYSAAAASTFASTCSSLASTSASASLPNSSVIGGLGYDLVKLRVRIRKDGISFMPVGMSDFKCIYKVKW